jgi:putative membrane protein
VSRRRTAIALAAASLLAVVPSTAAAQSGVSTWDRHYLQDTAEGAHFEIDLGRIVARHATSRTARSAARRMVADHGRELSAAKELAATLHVTLPQHPSIQQRHEIAGVAAHTGSGLDRAYVRLEIADHVMDIEVNDGEVVEGAAPAVKTFAETWLPMYRTHLALFRSAANTLHV